jgi:hypothetical protein
MDRTLSAISPYRIDFDPQELLPAMPPMVQRAQVDGSTGKNIPPGFNASLSAPSAMPGSTRYGVALYRQDLPQVLGAVDDQRAVDGLAALAGPAAARQHGHAFLPADRHGGGDVLRGAGHQHADGLHLVDRGIGRVAAPVAGGEQDLARGLLRQALRQAAVGDPGAAGDGVHAASLSTPGWISAAAGRGRIYNPHQSYGPYSLAGRMAEG